jgi:2-aminoadipate transaminase
MNATISTCPPPSFARRATRLRGSVLREILSVTQQPDVISLAGGLPSPGCFPVDALRAAFDRVLRVNGAAALQYSTTEGHAPLRDWIARYESSRGVPTTADEVLIVSGSQQALDLVCKALVDPGDAVLVEAPTYPGALQAFTHSAARCITVPTDRDGLQTDRITAAVIGTGARLLYVMPNFQNPGGHLMTASRRTELADAARTHGLWLIEDDPYGDLWFRSAPPESLRAHAPERTVRICSLSKTLAPGLRLGYIVAPRKMMDVLVRAKQAADLHTSTLSQFAAHEVLASGVFDEHLASVRARYAAQCDVMARAISREFPQRVQWTRPAGGMFIWVALDGVDTDALLTAAVERRVAFVPGSAFYAVTEPYGRRVHEMRLSFATAEPAAIDRGIATLGELLRAQIP